MAQGNFRNYLDQLLKFRTSFGKEFCILKISLLTTLKELPIVGKKNIIDYHELLLFISTHPDNLEVLNLAKGEMKRLVHSLEKLSSDNSFSKQYSESGLAFSTISMNPTPDFCNWLVTTFVEDVTIDWDDDFTNAIGPALSFFCLPAEQDGLTDDRFDALDWVTLKTGINVNDKHNLFKWVVKSMSSLSDDPYLNDYLFGKLETNVKLRFSKVGLSRSMNILQTSKYFFHDQPLNKNIQVIEKINQKTENVVCLTGDKLKKVIDSAKATMAARGRETDPFTYAESVRKVSVELGLDIYLFTMTPQRRLPIENYTGFMVCKNGVPVGYGGGWIFIDRCEIGVNIFDTFRGGENNIIFTNILRAYNHVFYVIKFVVPTYQFGEGNDEGIKSGAFWFYYKLGFRPIDDTVAKLAETESNLIAKNKNYRTPFRILKKFTQSPLMLLNGKPRFEIEPKQLSIYLTNWIRDHFDGNSDKAKIHSIKYVTEFLAVKNIKEWPVAEQNSFYSWAPLVAMTNSLSEFSAEEKKQLVQLMREKGGDEISFSRLLQDHTKLLTSFLKIINS